MPSMMSDPARPASPISQLSLSRKLKLQQLIVVAKVIDSGSLLRAANEMGMTQPAITKAVQELEAFLEAPLFERSNRGVVPTELGRLLGERAKSMITELRYLTDEINALQRGTAGHVIVGTLISASARLLPLTIAKLKAQAPGVLVTVREASTPQLFPALATGDLDIAVGRLPERELPLASAFPLQHEVLFEESMCIVVGARHRFDLPSQPHLADLRHLPWIVPLGDSPARMRAERLFQDAGLALPENRIESLSMLTNIGLLLETACVALMPRAAAQQFVGPGLLSVLDVAESGDFGAVGFSIRADRKVSAACQRFIACLRDSAREIAS
ncbi:LysR family transcriptional regulator [Chitinasiproducens palmae]|uniref:DNA-binding transcriptional regulator, LysR family n=1 Tax=Chitinasiproducens palmae TaxID=1770053 RepID=A0A1H2PVH9_9BURK|nr:LysR substrate-binding domain-containing protein [Chitinasiproducens palmae]SDV51304.1 DNA-binding transcriptional regulator, LysR family [Chitinasiproducens palmae]